MSEYVFGSEVLLPQAPPFVRWLRLVVVVIIITAALTTAQLWAVAEMLR